MTQRQRQGTHTEENRVGTREEGAIAPSLFLCYTHYKQIIHHSHHHGTDELAHWEMLGTMIHQCMQGLSCRELDEAGLAGYYVLHSGGVFPCDPNGVAFTTAYIACTGDPIADITEDMAAEQKARATYEHLMNMTCNEQIIEPLCFLREREVVHFQRFGECLNILQNMSEECRCGCMM